MIVFLDERKNQLVDYQEYIKKNIGPITYIKDADLSKLMNFCQ